MLPFPKLILEIDMFVGPFCKVFMNLIYGQPL